MAHLSPESTVKRHLVALLASVACASALAQAPAAKEGAFEPYVGQPGKDVVWVPTPEAVVNRMLDMAKATPQDFLVDLGSGDGRTVIAAAKRGMRAMGVEFNPDMVAISNREAQRAGVADKVKFVNGDIFAVDFKSANIVTMYLLPSLNVKLRPQLLDMRPGTRLVSHAFNMGDWEADETATPEGRQVFLWIVPAKVNGTWNVQAGGQRELTVQQTYQKLQGTMRSGGESVSLFDAQMRGDEIRFAVLEKSGTRRDFTGKVNGNSISGTVRVSGQPDAQWSATRR
jgi:SAM-dependent methyltransferase